MGLDGPLHSGAEGRHWPPFLQWQPHPFLFAKAARSGSPGLSGHPAAGIGREAARRFDLSIVTFNIGGMAEKQYELKRPGGGVTDFAGKAVLLAHQFAAEHILWWDSRKLGQGIAFDHSWQYFPRHFKL